MDYCSSCRRHLNGALVCPGCGAYAPDIAPPATVSMPASRPASRAGRPAATPVGAAGRADASGGSWFDGGLPEEPVPAGPEESVRPLPDADVDGPPPASRGRAARRRQLARWKKNKRRAAVATTIALVGGGLTLAALDRQSPARAQAASAPDDRGMGSVGGQATEVEPEPASPDTHASPVTGRHAHTGAAAAARHGGSLAAPRTAASNAHADAAAAPLPARAPAVRHQAAAPVAGGTSGHDTTTGTSSGTGSGTGGGTGTTAQQPPAPAATPSTGGTTDSSAPRTSPSPAATAPSQLCLLVVCLG
ncbi:SCO2400 family protein [Streptomyces collinus]|uniref:SCO2400 family protein n=1 Tax=Streptomyces collinus TaxID=42684 RepID=UPI0033ED956A